MDIFDLKVTAPPIVGALTSHDIDYVINRIGHCRFLSSSTSELTVLRSKLYESCKTMALISQIFYEFFELEEIHLSIDDDEKVSVGHLSVGSFITRQALFRFDRGTRIDIVFNAASENGECYSVKVWRQDRLLGEHEFPVKDKIYSYDMCFPAPSVFVELLTKDLNKE